MRWFKTLMTALVALALLAGLSTPVIAQDDASLQLEDLDGIQQAVWRSFITDTLAAEATPGATQDGWLGLITMALAFDSDDAAARAVPRLSADLERAGFAGDDGTTEEIQLDIDRDHVAYLISTGIDEGPMTFLVVVARDGACVDVVMGATLGEDPEPVITTTLTGMAEAEAGDGEGAYRADGTSEGGLWDKLPDLETMSTQFPGQVEAADQILYPNPSPAAVSTPARVTVPVTEGAPAG